MNDTATAVETFIGKHLHNELFLEEYVFPRSKFRTPDRLELELADAVVALGDVLLICQIKERDPESVGDEETERRWFRNAVLKDATKQVRNTLRYLQDHAEINVVNERGRTYNLAAAAYASVIKIVLYLSPVRLPADCASTRYHVSGTAGFIHVVGAQDCRNVFRTLRVPAEIVAYVAYREAVLTRFGDRCGTLPEPCLVGHFVGHGLAQVPTIGSALAVHALVQDEDQWDMAPMLRRLHVHDKHEGFNDDYYAILGEFMKLRRSQWREVKRRVDLCLKMIKQEGYVRPYRIVSAETDCGFIFVPVAPEMARDPRWEGSRVDFLLKYTIAHKHDRRLRKCVGFMAARVSEEVELLWCHLDEEWRPDPVADEALLEYNPLRPMQEAVIGGFLFAIEDGR